MLGIWKNVEELEMQISLDELEALLNAAHERETRQNKFAAALKGVDLDEGTAESVKEKFDSVKRRVEAKANGKTEIEAEYAEFGLDVEIEE